MPCDCPRCRPTTKQYPLQNFYAEQILVPLLLKPRPKAQLLLKPPLKKALQNSLNLRKPAWAEEPGAPPRFHRQDRHLPRPGNWRKVHAFWARHKANMRVAAMRASVQDNTKRIIADGGSPWSLWPVRSVEDGGQEPLAKRRKKEHGRDSHVKMMEGTGKGVLRAKMMDDVVNDAGSAKLFRE